MTLHAIYIKSGATLAGDGIPLHFGDLNAEYHAALNAATLLDRSHEGRITLTGEDRFDLLQRISTNDVLNMKQGEGRPTIFLNANARILDRVVVFNQSETTLLLLTEPGRGGAVASFLQRNIFFNDKVTLDDITSQTQMFALHGPIADKIVESLVPKVANLRELYGQSANIADASIYIGRLKPLVSERWFVICQKDTAPDVWRALVEKGEPFGLLPAGGITYNTLRIRAGRPGVGRELTAEYIPLELGLWDEISFTKGCYTGQEIIARMESRNRLARMMVSLQLENPVKNDAQLYVEGKSVGKITSAVISPDDEHFAIAVIKSAYAEPGTSLNVENPDGAITRVKSILGVQPRLTHES
jgi:folate-binding protein YgfZ